MKSGIYKIENKINGKIYIGETMDIDRRWKEHVDGLDLNKHVNYKLQKDWNKYGGSSFEFAILEEYSNNNSYKQKLNLIIIEDKYIKQFNSIINGYNIENTLEEVLNGNKIIFSHKDKLYLKNILSNDLYKYDLNLDNKKIQKIKVLVCDNNKERIISLDSAR